MRQFKRFLVPSLSDVVFMSVFLPIIFGGITDLLADGDTGFHIRAGEYILRHLSVPKYDIFAIWNPPLPWIAHEWLSEILMQVAHHFYGLNGVVTLFSLIIALASVGLFQMLRRRSGQLLVVFLVTLAAVAVTQLHWLARPHIFSLLLTVIWYDVLSRFHYDDKNLLYILPPVTLIWVNLHGGFILGIALLGVYLFCNVFQSLVGKECDRADCRRKAKWLAFALAACLAASLLNPRGYELLLFPFDLISRRYILENISEFQSPNFHRPYPFKYYFLLMLVLLAVSRYRLGLLDFALTIPITYMSLYSVRYIPLFAVITAPILVESIARNIDLASPTTREFFLARSNNLSRIDGESRGHLAPVTCILGVLLGFWSGMLEFRFDEKKFPVSAVEFVKREQLNGHMFTHDAFGDYVIYAAWPQYRVFIDGRSDMYGGGLSHEMEKLTSAGSMWQDVIRRYDISWILFNTESALTTVLYGHREWHPVYTDALATIFVRKDGKNKKLIEKYSDVKIALRDDPTKSAQPSTAHLGYHTNTNDKD